jgi:phosphoribosylformylglycinamidine cyclo-ligase
MRRTFNLGVGLILACAPSDVDRALALLTQEGERAWTLGRVVPGEPEVRYA